MFNSKGKLRKSLQSIFLAAAVAVTVVPVSFVASEPITVEAASSAVKDALNESQKKIFDAYEYLDTRIMDKGVEVTSANKGQFESSNFYTMYTNSDEKKKYSNDDLKYARRAYIYSNPYEIAPAMAELKFVTVKNSSGKYSCFAYLRKTGDNDYSTEKKNLKSAVKRIMKNIDDDASVFTKELECFNMIIDNVTNVKVGIDNKDLKNTAYGALVTHRASSQGYALAFSLLLDECDVQNDILFNESKCWNQVKIGKWYETNIPACDKAKKGKVNYDSFNVSQKTMKNNGYTRVNYCTKLRTSNGKHSDSNKKVAKYEEDQLYSASNYKLAVLNPDNTTTRTNLTVNEKVANVVPVFVLGSSLKNISSALKACIITLPADSAFAPIATADKWTVNHPYITLRKGGKGGNRNLTLTFVLDDGSNNGNGTQVTVNTSLNDENDTTGSYVYKVTGDDTAALVKCTKTKIKNVKVPSSVTIDGKVYKVTKIEKNAFKKCKKVETVMIGAYVTEIGNNAFSGKTKLIRVENQGFALDKFGKDAFKSANDDTFFLIKAPSYSKYKKIVKKIKKAGGKNSVYKYRAE